MFHRTERLLLRPGFIEDAPELARAIGDPDIVRNLAPWFHEGAPWPYDETHARTFLERDPSPRLPNFLLTLRTRGAPRIVGSCGLGLSPEGGPVDGVEIGYWIARPYWGLGFATEATRAVVAIARAMGIADISSGHFADNPASGRVLAKSGFRPTGRIAPRHSVGRGGSVDCILYRLAPEGEDGGDSDDGGTNGIDMDDWRESIRQMAA